MRRRRKKRERDIGKVGGGRTDKDWLHTKSLRLVQTCTQIEKINKMLKKIWEQSTMRWEIYKHIVWKHKEAKQK